MMVVGLAGLKEAGLVHLRRQPFTPLAGGQAPANDGRVAVTTRSVAPTSLLPFV